jgi:hypothetical protein
MVKRLAKPTKSPRRTSGAKRKSKLTKKELSLRAKKGWETRRRRERVLEETKRAKTAKKAPAKKAAPKKAPAKKAAPKKAPAKKAAPKKAPAKKASPKKAPAKKVQPVLSRRAALAKAEATRLRRSKSQKAAWAKRKRAKLFDERASISTRKDIREDLPAHFKTMDVEAASIRTKEFQKRLTNSINLLSNYKRQALIDYIVEPSLKNQAINAIDDTDVLAIAIEQAHAILTARFEKADNIRKSSVRTVVDYYGKQKYGTVFEAIHAVDTVSDIIAGISGFVETEDSKLKATLIAAYSTPQFDAIMKNIAEERGMDIRALYSFFHGSPTADLYL